MSPWASGGPEVSHTGQECYIEGGQLSGDILEDLSVFLRPFDVSTLN